jgi:serine/threonine-protein kinase SRPK3
LKISDHLHGRYRIVHKLGYGASSTTWLARDEKSSKYVAIKVGTADSDQRKEAAILSHLTSPTLGSESHDRRAFPTGARSFGIVGPNGTHSGLVTALARCSLADVEEASWSALFQLEVARSLAAQLAVAVAYVHGLGYVHGGTKYPQC